tara:strand:- start:837 stop:1871 length:1035 start_codon:yes stop_codon:yes gene_type:complete
MAQFILPDIPGSVNRGLQFAQQQKMNPLKVDAAELAIQGQEQNLRQGEQSMQFNQVRQKGLEQQIAQRTSDQKNKDFVNFSLRLQSLPDDQKLQALLENKQTITNNDGDTSDTDAGIELAQAGNFEELNQGLSNIITQGERQGIIKSRSFTEETLNIRKQEAELRLNEQKQKNLDRDLRRETNEIKKEELELKSIENKRQIEQAKKDREFAANGALSALDQGVATVDSLLEGDGLESATGFQGNFPTISGSPASGFEAQLDKLKSQTFLLQVEKMKGLGALGEKEGAKLESALAALSIKQPDKKLRSELVLVKKIMSEAKSALQTKFGIASELDEAAILAKYGL